jgi:hypothetical protein
MPINGAHSYASPVILTPLITSDKWWPQCQIWTLNSKKMWALQQWAFQNTGHKVWSLLTSYTIWHTGGTLTYASSVNLTLFISGDKWWPQCQIWTSNSKQNVGIVAKWLLPEYRTNMINMDQLYHHLTHWRYQYICFIIVSLTPFITGDKWWSRCQIWRFNRKKCRHCSNGLFLNTGHWIWSIWTSYTIWHIAGTHTYSIHHPWQMMASVTNMNIQQQKNMCVAAMAFFWIQDMEYDQCKKTNIYFTLPLCSHALLRTVNPRTWHTGRVCGAM